MSNTLSSFTSRLGAQRTALSRQLQPLRQHWHALSAREHRLLQLAAAVLALALLWLVLIAPALRTLREAPAQRAMQEQQLARMQQLQGEAKVLLQQPRISQAESQRLLEEVAASVLGKDSILTPQGAQVQVQLRNVAPATLAQFLQQAREIARATPHNAQLERTVNGWNGSMVLQLPA